MRTIRTHAPPLPLHEVRGLFPGLEGHRIWLEQEIVRAVRVGVDTGVDWRNVIVHLEPDGVTIRDREAYTAQLRRAGVRELVSQLRRAEVPRGRLLAVVDLEGATWLSVTSIAGLLGEEAIHA